MRVAAIIVTFNSNATRLNEIFNSLTGFDKVVVSDNSTLDSKIIEIRNLTESFGFDYIPMSGNRGIAVAQNIGISHAIENDMSDFVLLDDDSLPAKNMLNELFSAREKVYEELGKLAVICATAFGEKQEILSIHGEEVIKGVYRCRDIISSGTLLNSSHIDLVGLHEEKLFIDCVDYEWGWRAISKDVLICIAFGAVLNHKLGTGKLNFIDARYGSPVRHYYQYRNILHMMKRKYVPSSWKFSQLSKLIMKIFLMLFFFDNKIQRLKYALMGVKDFVLNRYGSIDNPSRNW